jgi:uncharacterized membrane protein AbrB (regulator of aidB expression)
MTGLGISFALAYLIYFVQVYFVSKEKFDFKIEIELIRIFCLQFALAILGFLSINFLNKPFTFFVGILLIVASVSFSFVELDKKLGLLNLIKKK